MSLIIISKVIPLNLSYYIDFKFIFKKIYKVYKWLFQCIKNFYKYFNTSNSNIILTDTENSFIQAIFIVYILISHFLCFWYINKNLFVYCKK